MPVDNSGALQPKHKSGLAVSLCPDVTKEVLKKGASRLEASWSAISLCDAHQLAFVLGIAKSSLSVTQCRQVLLPARVGVACRLSLCDALQEEKPPAMAWPADFGSLIRKCKLGTGFSDFAGKWHPNTLQHT